MHHVERSNSNPEPFTAAAGWSLARLALELICRLFGAPASLMRKRRIDSATRAALLAWLRPLEAFARRLLLIEAASQPPPNAPRFTPKQPYLKAGCGRGGFADEDSTRWSVSFKTFPAAPRAARKSKRKRAARNSEFMSSAALAERLEAIMRLAENPDPAIRRVARRLRANRGEAKRLAPDIKPPRMRTEAHRILALSQAPTQTALKTWRNDSS